MEMKVSQFEDATLVELAGRLDTAGVSGIEARFTATIVPKGRNAIVDLTKVDFLASLGIRMLISTGRALAGKGARLALFGASPYVTEVLESTSLMEIIPLADTPSEALALITS
jgi:anti-sigma B factor antagonist